MPSRRVKGTCFVAVSVLVCWLAPVTARADLVLTVNAAGSQTTTVAGATTETFDGFTTGTHSSLTTAVGTFNAGSGLGVAIVTADQFGGAGGSGKYFAVGTESGTTKAILTLNSPQAYFGFWWSAADANNSIELLSGGVPLATLNSATALGSLSSAYNGNPNSGQDSSEKFAYLNFVGTNGTTFDEIIFQNNLTTGFEADNFSVSAIQQTPPPGTIISGGLINVPEPSSLVLLSTAGFFCGGCAWYRRKKRASMLNHSISPA